MSIGDEPHHIKQVRSGMCVAQCVATAGLVVFMFMPLLTELGSSEDGFCYRNGTPNGVVRPSQHSIPPKTAKKQRDAR
jgi:hypothetical protein